MLILKNAMNIFSPPLPSAKELLKWQMPAGASIGLILNQVIKLAQKPVLIIAPDSFSVSQLDESLRFFSNEDISLLHFPDWEILPYDHFSPHQDIISERLTTLYQLPRLQQGAIITTVSTLLHYLCPRDYIVKHSFILHVGDIIHLDAFKMQLNTTGYRVVSEVREHGEYAIRGSIIDLFPMGSATPLRLDLFDNEVESIRLFNIDTQLSLEKIQEIRLLPAKEYPLNEVDIDYFRQSWRTHFSGNPLNSSLYQDISAGISASGVEYYLPLFFKRLETLFDYLPVDTLIITLGDILVKSNEFYNDVRERFKQINIDHTRPLLKPEQLFLSTVDLQKKLQNYACIDIGNYPSKKIPSFNVNQLPPLAIQHQLHQPLTALTDFIVHYEGRILFCAESYGRREVLLQLFKNSNLAPHFYTSWQDFLAGTERLGIALGYFDTGFCLTDINIAIIPENELYGKRVVQRRLRKKNKIDQEAIIRDLTELQLGDAVVHIDHGIAYYRGLQTLKVGEQIAEFLCLEYQNNDKLYVPVASLHVISRYTGADIEHIPVSKLGTEQWQKAKRRAAEKAKDVAAELLELYAHRVAQPGQACILPETYPTFAAAFPFEETLDQSQAIENVFNDMIADKPMDRVICGDVGFGKTEVALRAAFLAVQNNKQVVMLVPTTLLAQQHFQTFQDRFADWPVHIEVLSRFKTSKEQKSIIEKIASGHVDIVVGTHKLLQTDIKFKNLGLVIIDEEHRFGVKQKEKLKALRVSVDLLTLTATPIPRTLNMALAGMRDLSLISTPPAKRLSVKTFIHEYQSSIVVEAIQREILRGGQVYFLHNEVQSIEKKALEIQQLLPEIRAVFAHGQMPERDLERVMADFYHRKYNVLICSTIIESGIDIPTANTIIINRADKFGIAQLHQLRGRVGRSHHQAYAYLLIPPKKQLTVAAIKRLEAVEMYSHLGIGFTLATHDLEIRGAGELLGEEQSGDIHAVGFSLYMELLERAVAALKSGNQLTDPTTLLIHKQSEIDLRITALIPENYLADIQLRLQFYKRIATAQNHAALDQIQIEMIDRFGLLPVAAKNLFALQELKQYATSLGIAKIEANHQGGRIEFVEQPAINPATIIKLIQNQFKYFRLDGPKRLQFFLDPHPSEKRIELVKAVLDQLSEGK